MRGRALGAKIVGLFVLVAVVMAACGSVSGVTIADVWSRAVPQVSPASSIYFRISNDTDTTITLTGGSSDACGSIELHETSFDDNRVMAMRPLPDGLALAPGESSVLAPLGIHLMCIEPNVFEGSFGVAVDIDGAADIDITVDIEDR